MSKESIIKEAVGEFRKNFIKGNPESTQEELWKQVDWLTSKFSEVYDKGRESATSNYFITSGIEEGRAQIQDEIKKVLGIES